MIYFTDVAHHFFFLLVNLAELSVFYFYLGQCMEVFFFDRQLNALIFE